MHVHRERRQSKTVSQLHERGQLLKRPVAIIVRGDHAQQSAQVDSGGNN